MTISAQKVSSQARIPGEQRPALPDLDVEQLVLHVVNKRKLDVDVRDIVTTASLSRSIEGASLLDIGILDDTRELLRSERLQRAIDVDLSGEWFRYVHPKKSGDILGLEFQPRPIARLRTHTKPMKVSRSKLTMAQFAQQIVRTERLYPIDFYAPELNKRQPIARLDRSERDTLRQPGISTDAKLTVKGQQANRRQLRNAEQILAAADDEQASALPRLAMMCAAIGESTLGADPNTFKGKYQGVLQARPGVIDVHDPAALAKAFLRGGKGFQQGGAIKLARDNPGISPGEIATRVEGSGMAASFYDKHRDEATKIIAAYDPSSGGVVNRSQYFAPYEYMAGQPDGPAGEDYWAALQRLATDDDHGWRCFLVANTVFFVAEADLFRGRPRAILSEHTDGVLNIDFGAQDTREVSEATIQCFAGMWAAPPGSVVLLEEMGPANGRWLVEEINRPDLFDELTEIKVRKPAEEMPEPRSRSATRSSSDDGDGDWRSGTVRERVVKIAKRAAEISKKDPSHYHYLAGGTWPTGDVFARDKPGERSDCSEFVIQVYERAGCDLPASLRKQGFTGTLAGEGRQTSHPRPGDIVLYGKGPAYTHVELYIGDGKTIGHGSRAVDYDTARGLQGFAGYWTFDFLEGD